MSSPISKWQLRELKAFPPSIRIAGIALVLLLSTAVVAPFYLSRVSRDSGGDRGREFITTHDLLNFVPMMEQFDKVLRSGVLYPRWTPDFNYGYGTATANFYPPGTLYMTSLINAVVNDWVITLLILSSLGLAGSYLAFYSLSRLFYSRPASALAALGYAVLPYHQLDLYWRGAIPEFVGFAIMPMGLYFAFRLGSEGRLRYYAALGLCHGVYLMSHLPVGYLFTYVLALYAVVWALKSRDPRIALRIAAGIAVSLLVSAIYWLPAALEGKYIFEWASETFPYHGTYITMLEAFTPFDKHIQEAFSYNALTLIVTILILRALPGFPNSPTEQASPAPDVRARSAQFQTGILILLGILTPFMSTSFSIHLSKLIPKIQIAVPPFRWLAISCLFTSLLVAAAIDVLRRWRVASSTRAVACTVALVVVIGLNLWLTAHGIILGALSNPTQHRPANFVDPGFTPKASTRPDELPDTAAVVISPEGGESSVLKWMPTYREVAVRVDQPSILRMKTYNFPGWTARIDGVVAPMSADKDGVQQVELSPGVHNVQATFENTPPRIAGAVLSAAGLLMILGLSFTDGLRKRGVEGGTTAAQSAVQSPPLEGYPNALADSKPIYSRLKFRIAAVLVVIIVAAIILIIIRRSDVPGTTNGAQTSAGSGQPPGSGSVGAGSDKQLHLPGRDSVVVAVDQKTAADLIAAIVARDQSAVDVLTDSGRALKVNNDTRVRVLQTLAGQTRVLILEGPHVMAEGWVPESWLK